MADVTLYQGEARPQDVRLRAASGGGAQSVDATPATATIGLANLSTLLETSASAAALAMTAVAATALLTLSVSATPATLTISPIAATGSPGVLAVNGVPSTLTLSPVAASASPGVLAVSSTPTTVTVSGVAATASFGALDVSSTPVSLIITAHTASSEPGALAIDSQTVVLTLSPVAATASFGAISVSSTPGLLAISPVSALASPGAISVNATACSLAFVPVVALGGSASYSTTPPALHLAPARAFARFALQQRQEPVAEYSINYQARTYGTVGSVLRGNVLSRDASGMYVTSTSAVRAAGYPAVAVALTNNDSTGVIAIKEVGDIDSSISGLGAGSPWPVIVNATGQMARKQTPVGGDYVIGQSDPAGNVLLVWPVPTVL